MSSLDEYQARYIDELITSAGILDSIEAAAQAEAWVSGALAEWRALGGPVSALAPAIEEHAPLAAALIDWTQTGVLPEGDSPWLGDLGRHVVTRVLSLKSNPDEIGLIFEYSLDGEHDHDISVSIVDGDLSGITIGPAGLADGLADDDTTLVVSDMDGSAATELVAGALTGSLDQLSPASEANVPLLLRRFGVDLQESTRTTADRVMPERDPDDDAWCVGVVRSALRKTLDTRAPEAVNLAWITFADRVAERDPDALTVLDVAGIEPMAPNDALDLPALLRCVGAYFKPDDLSAHSDAQFDALVELEPVDWAGVVLGMSRVKADHPPLDGESLVTFINRAPEITSSIPKSDAPRLAWAFEQMLFAWQVTGVIDDNGQVTAAGRWLLAQAYVASLDV